MTITVSDSCICWLDCFKETSWLWLFLLCYCIFTGVIFFQESNLSNLSISNWGNIWHKFIQFPCHNKESHTSIFCTSIFLTYTYQERINYDVTDSVHILTSYHPWRMGNVIWELQVGRISSFEGRHESLVLWQVQWRVGKDVPKSVSLKENIQTSVLIELRLRLGRIRTEICEFVDIFLIILMKWNYLNVQCCSFHRYKHEVNLLGTVVRRYWLLGDSNNVFFHVQHLSHHNIHS